MSCTTLLSIKPNLVIWSQPLDWYLIWNRSGRSPGEGHGNPTSEFLPGESHGQRSLAAYKSIGSQRDGHDWSDLASMQPHMTRHKWRESRSVVSDSLWHHGLYSPCNSPGQNTGVGSSSLLQGIFLTQESNLGLLHYMQILYQLSYQGHSWQDTGKACHL